MESARTGSVQDTAIESTVANPRTTALELLNALLIEAMSATEEASHVGGQEADDE